MAACITNTPRTHKIGISAPGAFDTAWTTIRQLSVISNNHQWLESYVEDEGSNGTPWAAKEGVVLNDQRGTGPITMRPRADDYRTLLPLLIGGAFVGNVIEPDKLCDFFRVEADKNIVIQMHENAKTTGFVLQSSRSSPILQLEWQFESCKFSKTVGGTFTPALVFSVLPPFVHTQTVLTIDGSPFKVEDARIECQNNIDPEVGWNSVTRTDLPPGEQRFTLTTTTPFDVAADVALQDIGSASVSASILYTMNLTSLLIEFPALHAPVPTPITASGNTPTKNEGIQWTARSSGTGGSYAKPIKFTLDDNAAL